MLRALPVLAIGLLFALAPVAGGQEQLGAGGLGFFADYGGLHMPGTRGFVSLETGPGAIRSFSLYAVRNVEVTVPRGARGRTVGEMTLLRSRNPGPNLPSPPYTLTMPRHPGRSAVELIRGRTAHVVLRPRGAGHGRPLLTVSGLPRFTTQVEIVFRGPGAHILAMRTACPGRTTVRAKVSRSGAAAATAVTDLRCG